MRQHYDASVFLTDRTFDAATLAATDVLRILSDGQPRTRIELAELLGVARATIALRVEPLISRGLITSLSDGVSTGGRRASRMVLNTGSRVILAADIGSTHGRVAITDLAGTVLAARGAEIDILKGPEPTLEQVLDIGRGLLKSLHRNVDEIAAIGMGLPGPVDNGTGRPANPPKMPGWNDFDISGWFRSRIDVPVVVDNDVNIMATGERAAMWPDVQHFMLIKVSTGVGAGMISGGELQRGDRNIAGQIGHIPVGRGAGVRCHCGNEGCVTAIASGPAVAQSLRDLGIDVQDSRDIADLVEQGDVRAIEAVRQAGRDLGEVLVSAIAFVNPSVIAVGGSLAQAGEHLLAGIREVVYTRAMPLATENLSIVPSKMAGDAGVVGASMMAIEKLFSPEGVSSLMSRAA